MQTTLEQIRTALASAYPLTVLVSLEEERLERLLGRFAAAAKPEPLPVSVWNCVDGFAADDTTDLTDPMEALAWIADGAPRGIYLLKDMGELLEDRQLLRRLRDTAMKVRNSGRFLFLLKPDAMLPETLKPLSYIVVSMFPDSSELEQTVRTMVKSTEVSDGDVERLVGALKGMSLTEVEHLLRRLLDRHGGVNEEFFKLVLDEKEQVTRKEGILEFVPPDESLEQLGGLDQLKEWVHERSSLFTPRRPQEGLAGAQRGPPHGYLGLRQEPGGEGDRAPMEPAPLSTRHEYGLRRRPGIRGVGLQPCARSHRVGGTRGSVDRRDRNGHRRLPRGSERLLDPNFLHLPDLDAGAPRRCLRGGHRQPHQPPAGRGHPQGDDFDQVFFVDLPNDEERKEILSIHMMRNGLDPTSFDLILLASATRTWNGAEIEQGVKAARITSIANNTTVSQNDMLSAIGKIIPLSKTMEDQLKAIRSWARNRALPATSVTRPEL